jgi:hypothetical protein
MSNNDFNFLVSKVGFIKASNIWDDAIKREQEFNLEELLNVNNNFVNVILDKVIAMELKVLKKSDVVTFYYMIDVDSKTIFVDLNKKDGYFRTTVSCIDDFKGAIVGLNLGVDVIINK